MLGPIRQEILSGIHSKHQFNKLKKHLDSFPDLPLIKEDCINAASFFNLCRTKGVKGFNTDFLICAVAKRCGFLLYTADQDFLKYSQHIPIFLHSPSNIQ